VSLVGLVLCRFTQIKLEDSSLTILGYLWLFKLGATLFLLYVGWIPQLDPASSTAWGYDPQRFYVEAQELIENDWVPDFLSLNYVGILYYYGAIFYVLGHNPFIPALVNTFVTLLASLYLVEVGYRIKNHREPGDWTLAFPLLLPEMVWFDVMTSRETLVAALLLFTMLTTGSYLARTTRPSLPAVLTTGSLFVLGIAAVRTSMLLPLFASIALMLILVTPRDDKRSVQKVILGLATILILALGPLMAGYLGGYEFDIVRAIEVATSANENLALIADVDWSENSIGMLLMPANLLQAILFLPLRMVLYLVAPLPYIGINVSDLLDGSWAAWQKLCIIPSSAINILAAPYALASLAQCVQKRRENSAPLVLHISYWVTFVAIAGGNLIIHERYRIMATLLLWGCAWLGARTCSKQQIQIASVLWYGLLGLAGIFYFAYKGL